MSDPQARILIGSSPVAAGNRHTYLLFERSDGSQTVVRGGPTRNPQGDPLWALADSTLLGADRYGDIKVSSSPYQASYPAYQRVTDSGVESIPVAGGDPFDATLKRDPHGNPIVRQERGIDWPLPGEYHERRVLWTGADAELQAKLLMAREAGKQITNAGLEYSPLSNNCNNVSTALLTAIGVTPALPTQTAGTTVSAPAFDEPLYQSIGPGGWRSGYQFDGRSWKDDDGRVIPPPVKGEATQPLGPQAPAPSRPGSSSAQLDPPARERDGLLHPSHPGHDLYLQAYAGVARLDEQFGRTPDEQSQRLAAALAAQGRTDGLETIQQVLLNDTGTRAFAVDNADASAPWARRSAVEVMTALQQPLEESTAQIEQANARAAERRGADVVQALAGPRVA